MSWMDCLNELFIFYGEATQPQDMGFRIKRERETFQKRSNLERPTNSVEASDLAKRSEPKLAYEANKKLLICH